MKRKVEWRECQELSEVYSGGLQMALMSPADEKNSTYKQATSFVTCKDFFQDAVQSFHLEREEEIFGFTYNPKKDPELSFDRFRVCVANTLDKDFASKVENVVDFVNQFEKKIHLIRTNAYECEPTPEKWKKTGGVWMFEGSGRWMIAPPMISLYTLLLRCGFAHKKGDDFDKTCKAIIDGTAKITNDKGLRYSGCYDDTYLDQGQPAIQAIMKHGYRRIFGKDAKKNFPKGIDIDTMHGDCGIVGFSELINGGQDFGEIKTHVAHWFKPMLPKKAAKPKKKIAAK